MNKLSEKDKIIHEQAKQIEEKEKQGKKILAATENLKGAYAEMAKQLDDTEALSTQAANDLSEKEKIIQEQAKLTEEKEKEGSSYALISKDKEILAAEEKLKRKKGCLFRSGEKV